MRLSGPGGCAAAGGVKGVSIQRQATVPGGKHRGGVRRTRPVKPGGPSAGGRGGEGRTKRRAEGRVQLPAFGHAAIPSVDERTLSGVELLRSLDGVERPAMGNAARTWAL